MLFISYFNLSVPCGCNSNFTFWHDFVVLWCLLYVGSFMITEFGVQRELHVRCVICFVFGHTASSCQGNAMGGYDRIYFMTPPPHTPSYYPERKTLTDATIYVAALYKQTWRRETLQDGREIKENGAVKNTDGCVELSEFLLGRGGV